MGIFTKHLSNEHQEIRAGLARLKHYLGEENSQKNAVEILAMTHALQLIVGEVHHGKEEIILFPALNSLSCTLPGGPNCTLHMGNFLQWDLVGTIKNRSVPNLGPNDDFKVDPALQKMIARNPYLDIPISEHRAGHRALALIQNAVESNSVKDLPEISSLYFKLMSAHITKEDDCLFQMVDELLSDPVQEGLLAKAIDFESQFEAGRIQEAKHLLKAAPPKVQ